MTDQPPLFPPDFADPVDTSTQITRMPGRDAPCHCGADTCAWPFCPPTATEQEAT